ncbi:MAG: metalloregulator ArsR/SmtB family transcription factor [Gammaproteobacteria bacterium]|nr:metalloregulator ArsR/SmtB family transcription factor [Gammaproteobacteria bacterium]
MQLETALSQLEAAAEPSRLRLLVLLLPGEATVGDLVSVLDQSQPRVSRHLRLLAEAGLVESFREGRSIYYRLADAVLDDGIGDYLAALLRGPDPVVNQDRERMMQSRRQREHEALRRGTRALRPGALPAPRDLVESLDAVLGKGPLGDVLDVGAGAGNLLHLLVSRARRVVGVDSSVHMRQLARSRLYAAGENQTAGSRWTIRDADAGALPFADGEFDLVILDEVLGPSDQPERILGEAQRLLAAQGRLLILDRVLPVVRRLPAVPVRGELSERQLSALLRAAGFSVHSRQWLPGRAPDRALFLAVMKDADDLPQGTRTGTHD